MAEVRASHAELPEGNFHLVNGFKSEPDVHRSRNCGDVPSGYVRTSIEMAIEIVSFPSVRMVDLSIAMLVITIG